MKKIAAFGVLALCLVALIGLQYKAMQDTRANEELLSLLRDTPAGIFYPVFIGIVVAVLGPVLWILIRQKHWSRVATEGSVHNAQKVARSLWRVDGEPRIDGDWAVMRFAHMSWSNRHFVLPIRPGHPDLQRFRQLKDGDTVEFEPLPDGMECALEHELCGYLRIKTVSK